MFTRLKSQKNMVIGHIFLDTKYSNVFFRGVGGHRKVFLAVQQNGEQ